ncbi:stage V sporulation protein D [Proteinivorax hydrogeniformans]|uniref:Stage V sporulation protein D n=1 Tax=Proteinivorax hydrogeniformans TaxID=1826727 RepID=A0AAU8HRD3_9FIRM
MKEQLSNVTIRKRMMVTFAGFLFLFSLLVVRLFWVQFVRGDFYLEKAENQWNRQLIIRPQRGQIYDRNGDLLAGSATAETIVAIPSEIENPEEVATQLAPVLDMEKEAVIERITKHAAEVYVQRRVGDEVAQEVKKLNLRGIRTTMESKRFYPHDKLASHVLGFAGIDEGLEGLEAYYEDELAGKPGHIVYESDVRGRELPDGVQRYIPPEDGLNMVTTIDRTIQHIVETEMTKAMLKYEPKGISVIAVDPITGEVLALANKPDYNPENYADYPQSTWRNALLSNSFEPGSTFKIVTLAAGLEENIITPTSGFSCSGSKLVGGRRIRCWRSRGHGSQTYTEVAENSCNPGLMTLGLELGKERLFHYIHGLGFGQKTGIDLPGESTGILFNPETMSEVDLAVSSFGQGNSVTPIQQVMGVAAVANGGKLMQPHLAKEFRDANGQTVDIKEANVVRTVFSEETAVEMKGILTSVVENGSGRFAAIEGYTIAGKTGTAQKISPDGGYRDDAIIGSFVGFAPVEDPQVVLYVMVDEPSHGPQWGSQIAAPLFKDIMEGVLEYMEIPRNYEEGQEEAPQMAVVPDLVNFSLEEARGTLEHVGFNLKHYGEGNYIIDQTPKAGVEIPIDSTIIVYTGDEQSQRENVVSVPNLIGKSIREAEQTLDLLNLNLEAVGSGLAVEQRPLPGEDVEAGSTITVNFAPPH